MVEIRYGDQIEVADLAGQTVSEVRQQFRKEFGIPDKARARLNGRKVSGSAEPDMELNADDRLSFAVDKSKAPFLVGALLLSMAITSGVFAFGFINASTNLNGSVSNSNFADVTVNSTGLSSLAWNAYGFYKGSIPADVNGTPIFNVDTATSGYTGDLVVTVSLGNTDVLSKVYRVLSLKLGMFYADGTQMDINESGTADGDDWVMLTLNNGSVSLFPKGTTGLATVRVLGGSYITNVKPLAGWGSGTAAPQLFCEVAQR
jgi:hypothetical protein